MPIIKDRSSQRMGDAPFYASDSFRRRSEPIPSRTVVQKAIVPEFTFRPSIDPISKMIGKVKRKNLDRSIDMSIESNGG